LYFLI